MTSLVRASVMLAALGWTLPVMAQTQCAHFELNGGGARPVYQPFDNRPTVTTFDLRVRRMADGVSGVRFLLVDRSPLPNGPGLGSQGPLLYDISWLEDNTRRVFVVGNEQPQPMTGAEVRFPDRSGVQISRFRIAIPAGQQTNAQQHREELVIRYQCLDAGGRPIGATQEQPAAVAISVTVPRYAAAYVGSLGQTRGSISFGKISRNTANLSKAIGITALSTLPYEVEFDSENDGLLKRRRDDRGGIGYTMQYGGIPIFDGGSMICPMTPAPGGQTEQFEVTLDRDSISQQPAGDYSDTVTITFKPRDVMTSSSCMVR